MTEQFTASEVRERAAILHSRFPSDIAEGMLHAYADRLEADEQAVPVAIVKDSDALYTGWLSWAGKSLPPETPLYTHPAPNDAERLSELARILKNANVQGDARVIGKAELKRALEILANYSSQAHP